MCNRIYCICQMTEAEATEVFMEVWDAAYTANEEAYLDTEPDIAGPLRELDRRKREEKNRRRKSL